MENIEENLQFLAYLINEEIYFIDKENIEELPVAIGKVSEPAPNLEIKPEQQQLIPVEEAKIPPVAEIKTKEPVAEKPERVKRKVVIMVGYQGYEVVPPQVKESLLKIFEALKINFDEIEIINVLSPKSPKVEDFIFEYLILMGGNGKNLEFMKNYTGLRNRYDIINHGGVKIFFSEPMDVYFKDLELKKKFWGKLKELFG